MRRVCAPNTQVVAASAFLALGLRNVATCVIMSIKCPFSLWCGTNEWSAAAGIDIKYKYYLSNCGRWEQHAFWEEFLKSDLNLSYFFIMAQVKYNWSSQTSFSSQRSVCCFGWHFCSGLPCRQFLVLRSPSVTAESQFHFSRSVTYWILFYNRL